MSPEYKAWQEAERELDKAYEALDKAGEALRQAKESVKANEERAHMRWEQIPDEEQAELITSLGYEAWGTES